MLQFKNGQLEITDERKLQDYRLTIKHCNKLEITEKIEIYLNVLTPIYGYQKALNTLRYLYWTRNLTQEEFERRLPSMLSIKKIKTS